MKCARARDGLPLISALRCRAPRLGNRWLAGWVALSVVWSSGALGQAAPAPAPASLPAPSAPVHAAGAAAETTAPQSEREALIEEGVRLRQEAKDELALATFQRAALLGRDGRVLAQIAFAEQAIGRWSDSYVHLREALADVGNPWVQERLAMLQDELKKIEANVGRLEVRTNVAVSKLSIDGKPVDVSRLGEPFIVPTGSVVVSAEAAGYLPTTRHVPVYAGSLSRAELVLVNEPTVSQRASSPSEPRLSRNPVWLYVAGAGALASIASVGPWVRGEHLKDGLAEDCSQPASCPSRFREEKQKVERLDAATNALLFGGLSVAALSTAAYFLFPRHEHNIVSAWVLPSSFGLSARGTY